MIAFEFYNSTKIVFGSGRLDTLSEQALPGKKALLLISNGRSTKVNGSLDRVKAQLGKAGVQYVVFDGIMENPVKEAVMAGAECARDNGCDFILALGGGAVLDPDNMRALKATGKAVLLTALPETIYRRVCGSDSRPLLKGGSMTDIVKILNQRRALYERYADCVIATDALTPEACAEAVLGAVGLGANLEDDRGTDAAHT